MTDTILVEDNAIVVPGEKLAEGMGFLPSKGTYRKENDILACQLGMVRVDGKVIKLIPLAGTYNPKQDDMVIVQVTDVLMSGWRCGIFSAYDAVLNVRDGSSEYIPKGADLTKYFKIGDLMIAKITNVTSQKLVDITMKAPGCRPLKGGRVLKVNSKKVPRIIGRKGSMVSIVKQETECDIVVGQNGVVWIRGEPEQEILAVNAIRRIEQNAHISGLTGSIQSFLQGERK